MPCEQCGPVQHSATGTDGSNSQNLASSLGNSGVPEDGLLEVATGGQSTSQEFDVVYKKYYVPPPFQISDFLADAFL